MDNRLKKFLGTGHCVVDLGCGGGEMLDALAGQFELRIGLDASTVRVDKADPARVQTWTLKLTDLNLAFPLETASIDAVVANQVIEHIVDPVRFATEIHRVLRPGGRCLITTPNIRYIRHLFHLFLSGYGPRTANGNMLDGNWDDGHIHYFTHRDMNEVFGSAGFSEIRSQALIDTSGGSAIRNLFDRKSNNFMVREFLSGNIMLQAIK